MRYFLFCCISLLSFEYALAAQTFFSDTIDARNNSPIVMLFAQPRPQFDKSDPTGTSTLQISSELTNYISATNGSSDSLRIDGETWRIRNSYKYQIDNYWHVQIQNSWIKHTGGISDRFIYHFHDVLALPQNGRSDEQHDQLNWQISIDGNQIISLENEESSWGDTELTLSWKPKQLNSRTQINANLKLPTGSNSPLYSSGNYDFSFSISTQNPEWFNNRSFFQDKALSLWYGAGIGYLGQSKEIENFPHHHTSFSLRTGLGWAPFANWILKMQLDTSSPLLDSTLREFGWIPIQISFESTHKLSDNISLSAMIGEDIRPRSVPDVVLGTSLSVKF